MGAINFSLDERLLRCLKDALPLAVFVETGTFEGDAVAIARPHVDRVVTVELSRPLRDEAARRFAGDAAIEVILGDSAEVLARIRPTLSGRSTLFWLDAHWCVAQATAGEHSQCPLLEELRAIGELGSESAILIDDARLFLAPPPAPHDVSHWPAFDEIVRALRALSGAHEIMVVNDVIVFHPPAATPALREFAYRHGVDWLRASQSLQENAALRAELEAKEELIHSLHAAAAVAQEQWKAAEDRAARALDEARAGVDSLRAALESSQAQLQAAKSELVEKERVIRGMDEALRAYRAAFLFLRPVFAVGARLAGLARRMTGMQSPFAPRLGNLNQHPPRALRLPESYSRPIHVDPAPRISIVTPSYMQARFIERTIESVLGQGYPDLEYHVQDGASDDGTRAILERYAGRLTSWDSSPDSGQTQAINRGFARTTGEIMAWLNSDDILLPGALAYVADFFNRNPRVDVVYGHRVLLDDEDREIGRWILPAHSDSVLSWADYVPQETLFWRRRIWDKVGAHVDESFRFAMDWDLLVRFREAGAVFARLPRLIGGFRIHPQQKTSASISDVGFKEMDRIRERALGRIPTHMEIRKALLPYLLKHSAADIGWRLQNRPGASS